MFRPALAHRRTATREECILQGLHQLRSPSVPRVYLWVRNLIALEVAGSVPALDWWTRRPDRVMQVFQNGSLTPTAQLVCGGYAIWRCFRDQPGVRSSRERHVAWKSYVDLVEQVSAQSTSAHGLEASDCGSSEEARVLASLPALGGIWRLAQALLFCDEPLENVLSIDECLHQWYAGVSTAEPEHPESAPSERSGTLDWRAVHRACAQGRPSAALELLSAALSKSRNDRAGGDTLLLDATSVLELVAAALHEAPETLTAPNWRQWQEACAVAAETLSQLGADGRNVDGLREANQLLKCLSGEEEFSLDVVRNWADDFIAHVLYGRGSYEDERSFAALSSKAAKSACLRFPLASPAEYLDTIREGSLEPAAVLYWISNAIAMGHFEEAIVALTLFPFGIWHAVHMADTCSPPSGMTSIAGPLMQRYADTLMERTEFTDYWRMTLRYRTSFAAANAVSGMLLALIPSTLHSLREQRLFEAEAIRMMHRAGVATLEREALGDALHAARARLLEANAIWPAAFYEWVLLGQKEKALRCCTAQMRRLEIGDSVRLPDMMWFLAQKQSFLDAFEAALQDRPAPASVGQQRRQILAALAFLPDYAQFYELILCKLRGIFLSDEQILEMLQRASRMFSSTDLPACLRRQLLEIVIQHILPQCAARNVSPGHEITYALFDTCLWMSTDVHTSASVTESSSEASACVAPESRMDDASRHGAAANDHEVDQPSIRHDWLSALAQWNALWVQAFTA